jgi:hypothetical protein
MISNIINLPFFVYLNKKLILATIFYKHGSMALFSWFSAMTISFFTISIKESYFGISTTFILLLSGLIMLDSFTGIVASRHEGEKVKSGKLMFTFYKFLMSFFFFWLLNEMQEKLNIKIHHVKSEYIELFYKGTKEIVEIISYSIFILLTLREWISIGENIERRYSKKFYLFEIVEKIFDIVEIKLIKWLENKEICK